MLKWIAYKILGGDINRMVRQAYQAGINTGCQLGFLMGKSEVTQKGFMLGGSKVDREIEEILKEKGQK